MTVFDKNCLSETVVKSLKNELGGSFLEILHAEKTTILLQINIVISNFRRSYAHFARYSF